NWRLALVAFAVLPLIVVVAQWFRRNVRDSYRVVRGWIARINAFLQENITGMATVQLFRREALNFERFDDIDRKHRDANIESIFYYAVFYPPVAVAPPVSPRARPAPAAAHIVFDRVWFAYDAVDKLSTTKDTGERRKDPVVENSEPTWVLKDITFEVRPGQRVGIVGATGSGKTTLINLLLRFYDVTRGRITVDGVDVRDLDLADLRGLFSLVLQDVHLFSGTIAANIRLGHPSMDNERVRRAARAVHAEPFIERMPNGFASAVAERGSTLSVGQKQLLSFARPLAFDPRVPC